MTDRGVRVGDEVETALGSLGKVLAFKEKEVQMLYLDGILAGRKIWLCPLQLTVTKEVDGDTPL